jgi:hypothetical protein
MSESKRKACFDFAERSKYLRSELESKVESKRQYHMRKLDSETKNKKR